MKCDAAVASAVVVTTLKAGAVIAEEHRAGVQECRTGVGTISERSVDHCRNGEALVALFERAICRARMADMFGDAPTSPSPKHAGRGGSATIRTMTANATFQLSRHAARIATLPKRRNPHGRIFGRTLQLKTGLRLPGLPNDKELERHDPSRLNRCP